MVRVFLLATLLTTTAVADVATPPEQASQRATATVKQTSIREPADLVRADVAAQNAGDWKAYLDLRTDLPGAPESQSNYAARWQEPDTGIRGNITAASIEQVQEIPIDVAKQTIDTCCYTADELRAFLAIIDYTVHDENAYVTNGPNARMYVLANTDGGWKIVQVSEPILARLDEAGYALGTQSERDLRDRQLKRLSHVPEDNAATQAWSPHTETTQPYPSTIRVGHFTNFHDGCRYLYSLGTISFTSYVNNVLPNEWYPANNFNMEALKAGALAVKGVGWYHKVFPKYPALGLDVSDSDCTQVYKPNTAIGRTISAFCAVTGIGFEKANGLLFYPPYFNTSHQSITYGQDLGTMYQDGTQYLANLGYSYQDIDRYYYDYSSATGGQAIQFFTYSDTNSGCTATTQPPTAPSSLSAVANSSSAITVSWSGSSNTASFTLYRWTGSWTPIATLPGSTRTFTDTGLSPSATYYYIISAQNTAGTVWAPNYTYATTASAFFGVVAPTGLWPNNTSTYGLPAHLSWTSVQNALWYNVAVVRWTGSSWVNVGTFYAFGAHYDLLTYQTAWYAWRAQAFGVSGAGAWSDWAYFYYVP